MHTFRCELCGLTFDSDMTEAAIEAERAVFADVPEARMAVVCDVCLESLRAYFPTLDARFKLEGL